MTDAKNIADMFNKPVKSVNAFSMKLCMKVAHIKEELIKF